MAIQQSGDHQRIAVIGHPRTFHPIAGDIRQKRRFLDIQDRWPCTHHKLTLSMMLTVPSPVQEGSIDDLATNQLLEEAQRNLERFKWAYYNAAREIHDLQEGFEREKQALSDEIRRLREHELHCHEGRSESNRYP